MNNKICGVMKSMEIFNDMDMGTNEKFFKKITNFRKLKKEAKRVLKEYCELNDVRLDKKWYKISKDNLYLWAVLRIKVNREYSGKND